MARASYTLQNGKKVSFDLKTLVLFSGDQLKDMKVAHPLIQNQVMPTMIYNAVTSSYGTGVLAVVPGHDIEGLKVASGNPHLPKSGVVDIDGKLTKEAGEMFEGMNAKEESTSDFVIKTLAS